MVLGPKDTNELIHLVKLKTQFSVDEITNVLIEMQENNSIYFEKKETLEPATTQKSFFSKENYWFFFTILLSFATSIILLVPSDLFQFGYLHSILGSVFLLFLPGYCITKVFFPAPLAMGFDKLTNIISKIGLSIGISLAVDSFVGLILNYTPYGIRLVPIVFSLLSLTVISATLAVVRQKT